MLLMQFFFSLSPPICASRLSRKDIFALGGDGEFSENRRESWSALDNRPHAGPPVTAAQSPRGCESSAAKWILTMSISVSSCLVFLFLLLFLSHTYLSSSRCLGKSCIGVIKLGLFCHRNAFPLVCCVKGRLGRMSVGGGGGGGGDGGGGLSQTVPAHLEWKATRKCLLTSVPAAQKPTKDHVAGCKHTTVSRRLCDLLCVFTRSWASFVARNKHDSVVR